MLMRGIEVAVESVALALIVKSSVKTIENNLTILFAEDANFVVMEDILSDVIFVILMSE